jgi:hypothetical protein
MCVGYEFRGRLRGKGGCHFLIPLHYKAVTPQYKYVLVRVITSTDNLLLRDEYRCAPISAGNTFQDLPRLRETADNTERYI